jgi:2-oxo-4-hydroxy-4-carboxy-5-ureidoimidazoline decarboxylase
MTVDRPTLRELNALDRDGFVRMLGGIFEHSPWVADAVWPARPFADIADLHARMVAVVAEAGTERQLELARAHPELAGAAMRQKLLTTHSTDEQAGAGLTALAEEEAQRFDALNQQYRERFGFPFIVAVREHTKGSIFAAFEMRLGNTAEEELRTALGEIAKITRFRLDALIVP